ncbi:MAG: TetR/AcrR family transcriptional regulator [Sandaracinaceae bacterium]|jgi:AcrR family transcriptional regulator|nr:TetR/AcrR family transcriptional regulator [Sandaracinaceae bacterium]MBP7685003.1 TetR/AcrR family transcriptional regulator [Deltaproteobacteria bacterium]MBK6808865.1 TetR/AcrR family transcriptional regulator [Sandaracinaceae bacterium]MBK7153289.1 TetR/AcrR family transcriptional regulator [Sandaracinaceae bacterium]MBK7772803.1 TetR/AcrR family transcriptional regulator [Sandaracinaceae bacterium]
MPKSRESPTSPRAYGGESHTERVTARHERLLEAGLELIGTEGRSAATVRAVCATSGLSQRYYYESFRDAEDLLTQVYQRQIARLEAAILGSVQPGQSLSQQVRRAADAYFTTIRADPRLGRVVLFEVLGVSPEVDALHRAGSQRFEGVVSALITSGLPAHAGPRLDLAVLSQAVVGAMVTVAGNWLLSGFDRKQGAIVESVGFVFDAVLEKLSR